MTVVLIGAHGAGKTSLGRALAQQLGWTFHPELGEEMALSMRLRGDASTPQEDFDRLLFERELDRDAAWTGGPRIVETWHPGNLAYAAARSPAVAHDFLSDIRAGSAIAVPVRAPRATLARRQHEPGDLSFFLQVGAAAVTWAQRLGMQVLPHVWTHSATPQRLAQHLAQRLRSL